MEKECINLHPARRVLTRGALFCSQSSYLPLLHILCSLFPAGLASAYLPAHLPVWLPLLGWGALVGISVHCFRWLRVSRCRSGFFKYRLFQYRMIIYALCIGLVYGLSGVLGLWWLPVSSHGVFIAVLAVVSTVGVLTFCVDRVTFGVYSLAVFMPVLLLAAIHSEIPDGLTVVAGLIALVLMCSVFIGHSLLMQSSVERQLASANRVKRLAVDNRRLLRLSTLDPLTTLANRRLFDSTLECEWRRAMRAGTSLSVMMMDVDFFKEYNDHYGHLQADECLRQIARVLRRETQRPADLAARFGGDEFCAVIPDTPTNGVLHFANRVYHGVARLRLPHRQSPCGRISVSIGVATVAPSESLTCEALLHAADCALYRAKASGRNRIHVGKIDWCDLSLTDNPLPRGDAPSHYFTL